MRLTAPVSSVAAMACWAIAGAVPATAQELLIGAGWTGLNDDHDAPGLFVEGRLPVVSLLDSLDLAAGAVASLDTDGDVFAGLGPVLRWSVLPGWRIDAGFMPGLYEEGAGLDLGSAVEFRSSLALSYALGGSHRIGIAYSHLSNGSIGETNPGDDSVWAFVALTL